MIDAIATASFERILTALREEIGAERHDMWFAKVKLLDFRRGRVTIGVPNVFFRDWILQNYSDDLRRISHAVVGIELGFDLKIDEELAAQHRKTIETDALREAMAEEAPANLDLTLKRFIERPENRFARSTVERLLGCSGPMADDDLVEKFNPLVIVGASGTGKSHLLAAICAMRADETGPGRVLRMTASEFTARFTMSLKTRTTEAFRNRFADIDLLCIDEFHRFRSKKATQVELRQLIVGLIQRGTQVVLAARHYPRETWGLAASIESLLLSGMMCWLEPYSATSLVEILRQRRSQGQTMASSDLVRRLARGAKGSVTELERRLARVRVLSALLGERLDSGFLDRHAEELDLDGRSVVNPNRLVLEDVCVHFGISVDALLSKRKLRSLTAPRQIAVYILRERRGLTFKEIGRLLGGRSHTSIHLMHKNGRSAIEADDALLKLVARVTSRAAPGES
ncbi:MAG: ATP-binding protein [Planctomycetes bacterium]|nr:ATP-binding protein [Planctomycetota bacterium]